MMNPTSVSDCIASGFHRTNCDRYGACNHCGSRDTNDDAPVQRTFGSIVGLEPTLPIAPHPYDYVDLEDTGGYAHRYECHESADGKYWKCWEERDDHETYIVDELLESIIEGDDDYLISGDCMDSYVEAARFDSDDCIERLNCWLEDNCEGFDACDKSTLREIYNELWEVAGCEANHSNWIDSSDHDFVIGSVEMGEHEIQVDVANHPVFVALADRGDLEDMLHASNYLGFNERTIYKDDKVVGHERVDYVSHGSFFMMNNTDIHHWWGCTNKQVWEACTKHIDGLDCILAEVYEDEPIGV
jgi:hypothetical protein